METSSASPTWMRNVLLLAAAYNLAWGGLVVLFPLATLQWFGMPPVEYPQLWQCIGMIVGVYGIGYAIAAFDPLRHWPIVLVGLLGKLFGPVGFVMAVAQGDLPITAVRTIITNDLIWWLPFALILRHAYAHHARRKI